MSYPPSYPAPTNPPAPPPPPAASRPPWAWIGTGLAALAIVVAGIVAAIVLTSEDQPSRAEQALADATQQPASTTPVATTTTPAPVVTPPLYEIELTPKILDKQCFGSAGCNVQFEVDMALGASVAAGTVWRVTYEVTGIEDGPLVGTFEMNESQYDRVDELVQTTSSKANIEIKATEIELLSS